MSVSQSRNTFDSDVKKTSSFSSTSVVDDGSQVVSLLTMDAEDDDIGQLLSSLCLFDAHFQGLSFVPIMNCEYQTPIRLYNLLVANSRQKENVSKRTHVWRKLVCP